MSGATCAVELLPAAARALHTLDGPARVRVRAVIDLLAVDPRPPAVEELVGEDDLWRVRSGNSRVVYEIHDRRLLVVVVVPGHRRVVCR